MSLHTERLGDAAERNIRECIVQEVVLGRCGEFHRTLPFEAANAVPIERAEIFEIVRDGERRDGSFHGNRPGSLFPRRGSNLKQRSAGRF